MCGCSQINNTVWVTPGTRQLICATLEEGSSYVQHWNKLMCATLEQGSSYVQHWNKAARTGTPETSSCMQHLNKAARMCIHTWNKAARTCIHRSSPTRMPSARCCRARGSKGSILPFHITPTRDRDRVLDWGFERADGGLPPFHRR